MAAISPWALASLTAAGSIHASQENAGDAVALPHASVRLARLCTGAPILDWVQAVVNLLSILVSGERDQMDQLRQELHTF